MFPRFQFFEQLEHSREKFAFTSRKLFRKKMHVTIKKSGDIFGARGELVFLQNASDDSGIGHAGELDIVELVLDAETFLQCALERFHAGAARMNQRAVNVEKEKALLHFCHVERSRDISDYF